MLELIKDTDFTVTRDLWKDFRNPSDKYLIVFNYLDDEKEKRRERRTTNNLTRFVEYINKDFSSWTWFNVFFRWTNLETGELKTAQIASYTKRNLPKKVNPTISEINSLLIFLKTRFGYQLANEGAKAYKILVWDKIEQE